MTTKPQLNAMTVDVEDYFHVSAFEKVIKPSDWDSLSIRVEDNTNRLLDLFQRKDVKCTFFTLGWVAKKCPDLIRRIVNEGHELASHGLSHKRATLMSRGEFRADLLDSKTILEQVSGAKVIGYRAPSFSVNETNTWVYEELQQAGFVYSSSTYPIQHDLYGVPDWPRFKHQRPEGIIEIPVPTINSRDTNIGIGGGGFFRLYPYWLSSRRIKRFLNEETQPYSFYFHPWEIDPQQPRVKGASMRSKIRHYINLSKMEGKLERLTNDFKWSTMKETYNIK
jgi:polysaccharide deacetylase family protein (PEP-CTERM system associated)